MRAAAADLLRKGVGNGRGVGGCGEEGEWGQFQLNVLLDADAPSPPFQSKRIRPAV